MTITATAARRQRAAHPLKSPLAAFPGTPATAAAAPGWSSTPPPRAGLPSRAATLAEFADYLRTITNRDGRPFQPATVSTYVFAGRALDSWMSTAGIDGDFSVVDTAMLNRFFRDYFRRRGQGGTNAQQRNLRHLFNYLQREEGYSHPTPATCTATPRSSTGPPRWRLISFTELLEVTGGGRARGFENVRDHAIICILASEGIRRGELLGMMMYALPADVIKNPVIRLVPLKSARASGQGRLVQLAPASARALATYLRARRTHKLAASDAVWLGTRHRGPLKNTGIRKMLERRAAQAGYERVTPHQFRHTFSHGWRPAAPRGTSCASTAGSRAPWSTATPPTSPNSAPWRPSASGEICSDGCAAPGPRRSFAWHGHRAARSVPGRGVRIRSDCEGSRHRCI